MSMKNFIFRAHREMRDKYPGRELILYIFKRKKAYSLSFYCQYTVYFKF